MHKNLERQVHESRQMEVVKQEMATVHVDILGISELNGLEWVNLTQMTIISTTVGKKKWSSQYSQLQSLKCSSWMQSQK